MAGPSQSVASPQNTNRSRLSPRRKLGFAIVSVVSVFLLLEVTARICVPNSRGRFDQINQIVMFLGTQPSDLMLEYDEERFWKLRPNVTINDPNNTFWQGTVSNSLGFRCPEFTRNKPNNTLRVVCFGDSSTFGIGAKMEDTWPSLLRQEFENEIANNVFDRSAEQHVEVINAGVPGYSSHQGLQHMRQELERLDADVVLASYANNDFWHWDHQTDQQHAQRISKSNGLRDSLMTSRLVQVIDVGIGKLRQSTADEIDPASPNQHWAKVATFNYKDPVAQWTRRVPLEQFHTNISSMADLCAKSRVPLILVKWPDQPQAGGHWSPRIEYQDVLDQIAKERNLQVADVVSMFQANKSWSVDTYVPNDIVHVNRDGNKLAAIAVRDAIRRTFQADDRMTN